MAMTMAADDGDNEVNGDGATGDDVGDGGMGAATGYDDDDAFDCCGVFQWLRRRTKARWRGQREMQQSKIEATAGRVATRGHSQIAILKISTLCSYKMRWYHVLRGEVHKKYVHQIIG